jgi:hypothetical protein
MTLYEALKLSNIVRRPTPKFLGSDGKGWVNSNIFQRYSDVWCLLDWGFYLTQEDLDATDWEAKEIKDVKEG